MHLTAAIGELGGIATRAELLARGVSRGRIQSALRRGILVREAAGLYRESRVPRDDLRVRRRGALAWAGPDAVLSHESAAAIWGLADPERGDVHVTVRHGHRVTPLAGMTVHQSRHRLVQEHQGWPVLDVRPTLIGLSLAGEVDRLRFPALAAVQSGLIQVCDLCDVSEVPPRARASWKTVAAEAQAGARSGAEAHYWRALRGSHLPMPQLNAPMVVADRRYWLDAYWPDHRLAAEIDGRRYHTAEEQFAHDRHRQNHLIAAGLVVLRFPAALVINEPEEAVALTEGALRARAGQLGLGRPAGDPARPRLWRSPSGGHA